MQTALLFSNLLAEATCNGCCCCSAILDWFNSILSDPTWFFWITTIIKIVLSICCVVPLIPIAVWIERRGAGVIQDRVGPNRVRIPFSCFRHIPVIGKFMPKKDVFNLLGLIQPAVDGAKLLLKQEFTPPYVRKGYFWIAPVLVFIPGLISISVIPLAGDFTTPWGAVNMAVANISAGPIFIFAISSLSVYGIALAGWSSNSKYPFLSGVRSSAQMISYEICMGLSIIPLFMIFSDLNLSAIVQYQAENGWMLAPFWGEGLSLQRWILLIPIVISFLIFTTAVFAEANRTPFDMTECETDLVGGYHTEYSSFKFSLFFMGEYAAMVVGSALVITLFLGGWSIGFGLDGWLANVFAGDTWSWIPALIQLICFVIKLVCFITFFVWVRWTLPRFRYDQVMKLGWLFFFELAVINIFITAAILYWIK